MNKTVGAIALFFTATAAHSEPIPMTCSGTTTIYESHIEAPFIGTGAALDLAERTFYSPVYGAFDIARIDETKIVFVREQNNVSVTGNLDRMSGEMMIFMMKPSEHEKMKAGKPAHFISYVSAKCAVTKRLF